MWQLLQWKSSKMPLRPVLIVAFQCFYMLAFYGATSCGHFLYNLVFPLACLLHYKITNKNPWRTYNRTRVAGYAVLFGGLVAVATYQSFYPVCLLVPGVISLVQENSTSALLKPLLSFVTSLGLLMVASAEIAGSWEFLEATYGFMWVSFEGFICIIRFGSCFNCEKNNCSEASLLNIWYAQQSCS